MKLLTLKRFKAFAVGCLWLWAAACSQPPSALPPTTISPAPVQVRPTATNTVIPLPATATEVVRSNPNAGAPPPTGHAYLVLTTEQPPYRHRLVRLPAACLVALSPCPPPEVFSAYPEMGVTPSHLYWAPNGQDALLLDSYEGRVLRFDPTAGTLTTSIDHAPAPRDQLRWLPDGRAIFVVQGAQDYTSRLVALNWAARPPQLQTLQTFEGMASLLGLDNTGRAILSLDVYGYSGGTPALKKDIVEVKLLAVEVATGSATELWDEVDWLPQRPYEAMPNSQQIVVGMNRISLWHLETGQSTLLGEGVIWPTGSPDGQWLAMLHIEPQGNGYMLRVMNFNSHETQDLTQIMVGPKLFWTPDSRYIVLTRFLENSKALGAVWVVPLATGKVSIPTLDLGEYSVVEDISWGP